MKRQKLVMREEKYNEFMCGVCKQMKSVQLRFKDGNTCTSCTIDCQRCSKPYDPQREGFDKANVHVNLLRRCKNVCRDCGPRMPFVYDRLFPEMNLDPSSHPLGLLGWCGAYMGARYPCRFSDLNDADIVRFYARQNSAFLKHLTDLKLNPSDLLKSELCNLWQDFAFDQDDSFDSDEEKI